MSPTLSRASIEPHPPTDRRAVWRRPSKRRWLHRFHTSVTHHCRRDASDGARYGVAFGDGVLDDVRPLAPSCLHPRTSTQELLQRISFGDKERVFHGHGHTVSEMYHVRFGQLPRTPDLVVWPGGHKHVEEIIQLAVQCNVCVIPFGGGTSVSGALECPTGERRMILSLDMHEMNSIKWIDLKNMVVCAEAGIVGQLSFTVIAVTSLSPIKPVMSV
mmetsp:Transcript_29670/g.69758  ORF Transcript_29670/g.69758 Transcript_29670/m.69758 type:complete len:216 (+) Transcript_29670:249-896(+)